MGDGVDTSRGSVAPGFATRRVSDPDAQPQLVETDAEVLARYAATIQLQRQDFNGRMLTIRRDDVRVLAAVLGRTPDNLGARLDELGLRVGN